MTLRRILVPLLVIAGAACGTPLGPYDVRALRDAEALWKRQNIDDYRFEMRTSCFCPPEITEWAIVEVHDDKVVGARSLDGVALSGIALTSRKTVNGLFAEVKADRGDWVADVELEFHDEWGYPTRILFESDQSVTDAGVIYEARNLIARD